jgi:WD40 repeat protein
LDSHIIVWTLGPEGKGSRVVTLELAHKDGVTVLDWLSKDEVVSSGNDAVICVWDVAGAIAAAAALKK